MNLLWAPWRMEYIKRDRSKPSGCVFCEKHQKTDDAENLVLYRAKTSFILMNLYPYNNGHLLIAPYRHIGEYTELTDSERREITDLSSLSITVMKKVFKPQGFNMGMNIGEVSGAGIADHLHQHIIPRWSGDTNFMPVIGQTKVMVEGLLDTWRNLRDEFEKY